MRKWLDEHYKFLMMAAMLIELVLLAWIAWRA